MLKNRKTRWKDFRSNFNTLFYTLSGNSYRSVSLTLHSPQILSLYFLLCDKEDSDSRKAAFPLQTYENPFSLTITYKLCRLS